MSTPMVISFATALAVLGLFCAILVHSRRRAAALLEENASSDASGMDRESFSDHYRPMSRILDAKEIEACAALQGLSSGDLARFRNSRISAFNRYLDEMRLDFNRIEFKLRYLMLAASHEEAELVMSLNKVKTGFQLQMLKVKSQVLLYRLGLSGVDVQPLVHLMEELESTLVRRPGAIHVPA